MNPALVLIDVQHDFLRAPHLEPAANQLIHAVGSLLASCRAKRLPVFHVYTTVEHADEGMPHWRYAGRQQCVAGTPGHATPRLLAPEGGEPVFHKRFFSAFTAPGFGEELVSRQCDMLLLCGVHLHGCVRSTALDAYQQDYRVVVAADAVGSDDPMHAAITRRYLRDRSMAFLPVARLRDMESAPEGEESAPGPAVQQRAEIRAAVSSAARAWPSWAQTPWPRRCDRLRRFADDLAREAESIAGQIVSAIGKPIRSAREEVHAAVKLLRVTAERCEDETEVQTGPGRLVRRRPLGAVALVSPWNNPVFIPVGKIAPALLYGNSVVWKPAEAAEGLARRVAACFQAGGTPELLQVLSGDGSTAEAIMRSEGIAAVTLTGSLAAGRTAQEVCARRSIPLQAELGGNNAAIVWGDADLDRAAREVAAGAFCLAGQRCTANRRAIVDESVYDAFLRRLVEATRRLDCGDAALETAQVGRLVSPEAFDRIEALIHRARDVPHRVIVPHRGDQPLACRSSLFYPPTIVCCDVPEDEIVQEESFGPVLVVQRAASWREALDLLGGVRQGLAAALFTSSADRRSSFLQEAEAGILKVNQSTAGADLELPFGGWKSSGIGPAEHGDADREFYTRHQAVYDGNH